MDYRLDLDLGELVPGRAVVARGVRLDGAALTLYLALQPAPDDATRQATPIGALIGCRYRPGGQVDDGQGTSAQWQAVVEMTGDQCRVTFPPPVDTGSRISFDLRRWGRTGDMRPAAGGRLNLDLRTGCALFVPLSTAGSRGDR